MSKIVNGRIILNQTEAKKFLQDIIHPDIEAIKKGEAFLKSTKTWTVKPLNNCSTVIRIPDLKLSPSKPISLDGDNKKILSYSKQNSFDLSLNSPISTTPSQTQFFNISSQPLACCVIITPGIVKEINQVSFSPSPNFRKVEKFYQEALL